MRAVALLAAALVVAVLVLYGTGLVDPPNLKDVIADLGAALGPYTYALVGILAFLETGAFVGLIAPGETAIIVGGVVAGQGEIDIVWLIALVWAAAVAGDSVSFLLGRRLGRDFLVAHGPRVKITEARLHTVERFFDRHGGKTILIGRFVGLVRAVAPFIAGASKLPYRRFLPYDVLGAGIWATFFCLLGYVFWQSFDRIADYASRGAFALGTVIVVVVGTIATVRWVRVRENRRRAGAWLDAQERRPVLRPAVRGARGIMRRVLVPGYQRARRPARLTWERFTPGELGLELTSLVAIAAVGTFGTIALALALSDSSSVFGDLRALEVADSLRTPLTADVARGVTRLGDGSVAFAVALLAAVFLALRRDVVEAAVLAAGIVLVRVGVALVKEAEGRVRPADGLVAVDSASFPSGHAAYGIVYVAVALALARAMPSVAARFALVTVAVAIAVAVGLSRVYLRVHYFSDVLGGWALASAIFALCAIAGLVVAHVRQNGGS